ncbi:MAG: DUF1015 domain-containing protein [Chromatiaceae bacterium]|nr:MAG: DUF1015 domain-containing protein [Chromatiaceae bacterium]
MPLIQPLAGLRPAPGYAAEVAAPPYDVVSLAEARALAAGRPWSFLHISRPEIDLPPDTDPYAPAVYAKARANLQQMLAAGVLVRDPCPHYYCYRLTMGDHCQTGLVAAAAVDAYHAGRIRRHELTRPAKEDDRVRQIAALGAQTGPVFLVYPAQAAIDASLTAVTSDPPAVDLTAADGVRHQLWPIADAARIAVLTAACEDLPSLYIADGHHRSAAAARVAADPTTPDPHPSFLAVLFPHDQVRILAYNRVMRDLNGLTPAALLERIGGAFSVHASPTPVTPAAAGEFGLYLDRGWYRLRIHPRLIPAADPVRRLDVSLLQDHLIGPVLGIADPRRDPRIDFVGGIRGLDGLCARVDSGEMRIAFALHPTDIGDLMAVADAGALMPPKSTWFEPKLADGLVSHVLD